MTLSASQHASTLLSFLPSCLLPLANGIAHSFLLAFRTQLALALAFASKLQLAFRATPLFFEYAPTSLLLLALSSSLVREPFDLTSIASIDALIAPPLPFFPSSLPQLIQDLNSLAHAPSLLPCSSPLSFQSPHAVD